MSDTDRSQTMTVVIGEFTRAPGSASASLHEYLAGDFPNVVRAVADQFLIQRLVVTTRVPDEGIDSFGAERGWSEAPDAVVQWGFSDEADALRAMSAGRSDGPFSTPQMDALADPARRSLFAAREVLVSDAMPDDERWSGRLGGEAPVKLVVQNWKRPDLTFDQFTDHWRDIHGVMVDQLGAAMGYRRYVQSHRVVSTSIDEAARRASTRPSPDGGLTEVWFTNQATMHSEMASEAGRAASVHFANDEGNFINPPSMTVFLARERLEFDRS